MMHLPHISPTILYSVSRIMLEEGAMSTSCFYYVTNTYNMQLLTLEKSEHATYIFPYSVKLKKQDIVVIKCIRSGGGEVGGKVEDPSATDSSKIHNHIGFAVFKNYSPSQT